MKNKIKTCCEMMSEQLNYACSAHENKNCPDVVVLKYQNCYGLPIKDGGCSFYAIKFCPWCGIKL